jgi:uncharacterized OB-fold protein
MTGNVDDPAAPFFEAADRGVLLIRACRSCETSLGPDTRFCSECLAEELDWREASGRGTLFTFGVMHQKMPGFEDRVPYPIAVVELEEGPRIYSTVVDCDLSDLEVGMPLVVTFESQAGEPPIPRFRPA